jgi:hypothetical protein
VDVAAASFPCFWRIKASIRDQAGEGQMNPICHVLIQIYELGNSLMWSLALLSVPFWLYIVVYAAPEAQIIAQQQQQNAIWRADRSFCEKLGMLAGTRAYTRCTKDLTGMRAQEDKRLTSEVASLF